MNSNAMESRFKGEAMRTWMNTRLLVFAWIFVLPAGACVGSELEAPANHPGHAEAHPGKLTLSKALRPEYDVQQDTVDEGTSHAEHAGHETHDTSSRPSTESTEPSEARSSLTSEEATGTTYVCPMHAEIV